MFKPQPLKFKHDALEPFMSEKTVDFHYNKHTKGYFDKTNKLIKDTTYDAKTLEEVVKRFIQVTQGFLGSTFGHFIHPGKFCLLQLV